MADKRPFAKIDTGYHMNFKWYQIQRAMQDAMPDALPSALRHAVRLCRDAHHASILYCRQNGTDGIFPVAAIKVLVGILDDEEDAALTHLFDSGMWINHPGGMAEVRDYLEHQTPSDETKSRSEAARKAANTRWAKHAENAKRNAERIADPQCREEERRGEKRRVINMADFDQFYDTYPRKMKRADAEKAYKAALAKTDPQTILEGAQRFANDPNLPDRQFIPYPATWLRADGWLDEPLPARGQPRRTSTDERVAGWLALGDQMTAPQGEPDWKELTA